MELILSSETIHFVHTGIEDSGNEVTTSTQTVLAEGPGLRLIHSTIYRLRSLYSQIGYLEILGEYREREPFFSFVQEHKDFFTTTIIELLTKIKVKHEILWDIIPGHSPDPEEEVKLHICRLILHDMGNLLTRFDYFKMLPTLIKDEQWNHLWDFFQGTLVFQKLPEFQRVILVLLDRLSLILKSQEQFRNANLFTEIAEAILLIEGEFHQEIEREQLIINLYFDPRINDPYSIQILERPYILFSLIVNACENAIQNNRNRQGKSLNIDIVVTPDVRTIASPSKYLGVPVSPTHLQEQSGPLYLGIHDNGKGMSSENINALRQHLSIGKLSQKSRLASWKEDTEKHGIALVTLSTLAQSVLRSRNGTNPLGVRVYNGSDLAVKTALNPDLPGFHINVPLQVSN